MLTASRAQWGTNAHNNYKCQQHWWGHLQALVVVQYTPVIMAVWQQLAPGACRSWCSTGHAAESGDLRRTRRWSQGSKVCSQFSQGRWVSMMVCLGSHGASRQKACNLGILWGMGLFLPCGTCQHYATASAVLMQRAGLPHSDVGVHGQTRNGDRMLAASQIVRLKGVTHLTVRCKPSLYLLDAFYKTSACVAVLLHNFHLIGSHPMLRNSSDFGMMRLDLGSWGWLSEQTPF